MRGILVAIGLMPLLTTGCAHFQLENHTLRQASTITDLRYREVLDNIAMSLENPDVLPYFAIVKDGTANVQNNGQSTFAITWMPASTIEALGLNGSHTVAQQWGLDPVKDPQRLKAMQCIFKCATGACDCHDAECAALFKHFGIANDVDRLLAGGCWYHVGRKNCVPKCAPFAGHACTKTVWVNQDGIEQLTRLTIIILDIATVDLASLETTVTREETRNAKGEVTSVKITSTESVGDSGGPALSKRRKDFSPYARPINTLPRPQ